MVFVPGDRKAMGRDLVAAFARNDEKVDDAVLAFTGLYPLLGGWGNWELPFTRHRVLALVDGDIQEWTALSGPTPGRRLRQYGTAGILVVRHRRYDSVRIGGRRFWIHRRYRATVHDWTLTD